MENGNQASQDPKSHLGEYLNRMSASMGPMTTPTTAKVTFNKSTFYTPTKTSTKFFAEPPPPNTNEPTAPKRTHFVFKKKNSKLSLNMITKPETPKPYSIGQGTNQPSPYSVKAKDISQLKFSEEHFRKVSNSNLDFDPDQKRNSNTLNQNQTFFGEANRKNNKDLEGSSTFPSGTLKIMKPESAQGSSRLPNVTENTTMNTDDMPPMNIMPRFHPQKPIINTAPNYMQYTDFLKGGKFTSLAQEKNEVLIKAYATPQHQKKRPVSSNQNLLSKQKPNDKAVQDNVPKDSPNNIIKSATFAKNLSNDSIKYSYKFVTSDETFEIPTAKDNFTQLLTEYNMKAYDEQLSEIKSTLKSMNFGKPAHARKESKSLAKIKEALYDLSHGQEQAHQEQKTTPNFPPKVEESKGISPRKVRDKKKLQGEQGTRQESLKEEKEEKAVSKLLRPKPIIAERCRTSAHLRNTGEDSAGLPSQPNSAGQVLFNKQIRDAKLMQSRLRRQQADDSQETHSISAYEASRQAPSQYYISNLRKFWKHYDEYNPFCRIYRDHFYQMFKEMKACKTIKTIDPAILSRKRVYLPKRETHKDKKTLIFDLDETLIHCNPTLDLPSDIVLPIKFDDGSIIRAGINIRPYAIECLKEMSKYYEVIVFTASQSCYANVILDYLDPRNEYIHHRLFRESCIGTKEGVTVKDLRILKDRNLNEIVIVDNSGNSMGCQIDNGIPIIPFHHNKNDTELLDLMDYLKAIQFENDLRVPNKNTFRLQDYAKHNSPKEVLDKVIMCN